MSRAPCFDVTLYRAKFIYVPMSTIRAHRCGAFKGACVGEILRDILLITSVVALDHTTIGCIISMEEREEQEEWSSGSRVKSLPR